MPRARGCLIRKNTLRCRAFLAQCQAVLFTFVTFFIIGNFCKLLSTVFRGKFYFFCYFLNFLLSGVGSRESRVGSRD
jgi:hypothetical protein